jgi:hypothetical protein
MVGRGYRLGNRLGIVEVVLLQSTLLRLQIGFDELRGDQPHVLAIALEGAGQVPGSGAGLHTDQARRQVGHELH